MSKQFSQSHIFTDSFNVKTYTFPDLIAFNGLQSETTGSCCFTRAKKEPVGGHDGYKTEYPSHD